MTSTAPVRQSLVPGGKAQGCSVGIPWLSVVVPVSDRLLFARDRRLTGLQAQAGGCLDQDPPEAAAAPHQRSAADEVDRRGSQPQRHLGSHVQRRAKNQAVR